ncbi:MAG: DUF3501 family protein [Actinobacteria bacterium]|nr:DUF3501 family protein [Actinomycetota bacterium]
MVTSSQAIVTSQTQPSPSKPANHPCTHCKWLPRLTASTPSNTPQQERDTPMSTMTSKRKLSLDDILDHRAYERVREERRNEVIEVKRRRRLHLGTVVTVAFENRSDRGGALCALRLHASPSRDLRQRWRAVAMRPVELSRGHRAARLHRD